MVFIFIANCLRHRFFWGEFIVNRAAQSPRQMCRNVDPVVQNLKLDKIYELIKGFSDSKKIQNDIN